MRPRLFLLGRFNNVKIGKRIIFTFVIASIVPILAIQFTGYRINSNSLKRKTDTLTVDSLTRLSERVGLTMDTYTSPVYQIYMGDRTVGNASTLMGREAGEQEVAFHTIYNRLQQAEKSVKGVHCISIICSNGQSAAYGAGASSSIENSWDDYGDLREIVPYRDMQGQPGMLITPATRYKGCDGDGYYLHVSKCMYDYNNLDKGVIVTIVVSMDESVLQDICMAAIAEDEAEYNINSITDRAGFAISYLNPSYTGVDMNPKLSVQEFVNATGLLKGQNTAVNTYVNEHRGWVYYNVYDKDYMVRDIRNNQIMFIIINLTAILFSSVLICYIVCEIGSSMTLITDGINQVKEGNLNVSVALESRDELGQIVSSFSDMIGRIRNLVAEVSQTKDQREDTGIRALEAQISSHLLYSALGSISQIAIEREEYEISGMLRNLGVVLCYSVSQSNQMASMSEVADWLERYASLQQMRLNQSFRFSLDVTEKARKVMVHKLLLQSSVENTIIHGFRGIERGGVLRADLFLSEVGERLNIIIEDSGKGMSRGMIKSFNICEQTIEDEGGSTGLRNAFTRMDMHYGRGVVRNVNSIGGMGAVVILTLPVNKSS